MSESNGKPRMLDLARVAADPRKLQEGSWFEIWFLPDTSIDGRVVDKPTDGPCVLVVPFGIAARRIRAEEEQPYLERIRARALTPDDERKILGRVLARAAFRGCHNLQADGELIVWSEQQAIDLMTNDRWIRLREFVEIAASSKLTAAAYQEEQALGN